MFVPVGRRSVPARFISVPFPTRQQRLSPGVCPACIMPYDRCHCDEPGIELRGCGHPFTQVCYCNDDGDGFTPATLWEPAIGVITDLGPLINQLNAEHIAACAAAPLPYRPLGSLLCRTCANELPDCTCFDGLDLTF